MAETLGQRIIRLREAIGLKNQADLARKAGVLAGTLSAIEADKRADPAITILVPIATALGVSLGYLVTGSDDTRIRLVDIRRPDLRVLASGWRPGPGDERWMPTETVIELEVEGDCMAPRIAHRDWVRIDPDAEWAIGKVIVLEQGDGVTLKRLRRRNGKWLLIADNPAYPEVLEIDPADASAAHDAAAPTLSPHVATPHAPETPHQIEALARELAQLRADVAALRDRDETSARQALAEAARLWMERAKYLEAELVRVREQLALAAPRDAPALSQAPVSWWKTLLRIR